MSHHSSRRKSRHRSRQVRFLKQLIIAGGSLLGLGLLIVFLALASGQENQPRTSGGTFGLLLLALLAAIFLSALSLGVGRLAATIFNVLKLYSGYTKLKEAATQQPLRRSAPVSTP